jgi:hypothetical protein
MINQKETRPMAGTMGGLVKTSTDLNCRPLTSDLSRMQPPLGAAAQREAAQRASRRLTAMRQAKKVLRSGGYLLHVSESGVERRLSLRDVWQGWPFLSVWPRDGKEETFTRNHFELWRSRPVPPRGEGWEFHRDVRGESSSAWRRRVRAGGQS